MKILLILFLFYAFSSYAYEFKNFKLTEKFRGSLQSEKRSMSTKGFITSQGSSIIENDIYIQITDYLFFNYQTIAEDQINKIFKYNKIFSLGKQNYSGFTWQKPMGTFSIKVNREVVPYNHDDSKWLVCDKFEITINAETLLGKLKNDGLIDISEGNLGAFAGISFRRTYNYNHFADSYEEGLQSDFRRAFLSFTKFRENTIYELEPNEYIGKQDMILSSANARVNIPIYSVISAGAEIFAEYNYLKKVTVHSIGDLDRVSDGERLIIGVEKSKGISAGAQTSLQIDFFNLLKLTLLSYELSYDYSESFNFYLNFYDNELYLIENDTPVAREVEKILKFRKINNLILEPFFISREEKKIKSKNSNLTVLLYGSVKRHVGEVLNVSTNNIKNFFFTSIDSSVKYIETITSFFWSMFIRSILGFNPFAKYEVSDSKELSIEYDGLEESILSEEKIKASSENQLSIRFMKKFTAANTTGDMRKSFKKKAIDFARYNSFLPENVINEISKDSLRGPISMRTTAYINKEGLLYLNTINEDSMFMHFAFICNANDYKKWGSKSFRRMNLFWGFNQSSRCVALIGEKYVNYKKVLDSSGKVDFWLLRDFFYTLQEVIENINHMKLFFGNESLYYDGYLKAMTPIGIEFKTYFQEGYFGGDGVIDTFMRDEGLRAPAYFKE